MRGAFGDDTAGWAGKIIAMFPTMADNRGKMVRLRVRIPPPKQAAAAGTANTAGIAVRQWRGGSSACRKAAPPVDPELEPDPVKPIREEMDDEIPLAEAEAASCCDQLAAFCIQERQ